MHWLLYATLLLVPLTGWMEHAAMPGLAPIWWPLPQTLPFVTPSFETMQMFGRLHIGFQRLLIGLVLLHVAGALKHHWIDRDQTLARMTRGDEAAGGPARHHPALPMLLAGLVLAAFLLLALQTSLFNGAM